MRRKISLSCGHGLLLLGLVLLINNSSYSSEADEKLLKYIFLLHKAIFPTQRPDPGEFIFVNTGKDLKLTANPGDWGNIAIADRKKLSELFSLLALRGGYRYIFCDLTIEAPSPDDSVLQAAVARCRNLLFAASYEHDSIVSACIPLSSAIAEYQTYNGHFSKLRLYYKDSLATVPVVMHHSLDKADRHCRFAGIAPRYYIRDEQLRVTKEYPYFDLGALLLDLSFEPDAYSKDFNNKIIVIGNFDTDLHQTAIGTVSGPLILTNTYLSLRHGDEVIRWTWLVFLFLGLSAISYGLFFTRFEVPSVKLSKWVDFVIQYVFNQLFSLAFLCALLVLLSEFFFDLQLCLSPILAYFLVAVWTKDFYEKNIVKHDSSG